MHDWEMKGTEAIFNFTPDGTSWGMSNVCSSLLNQDDFRSFIFDNLGTELTVEIKEKASYSEKERMYAYYHGPLLRTAIRGFSRHGYEGMDKYKADYLLKCVCAKSVIIKDGEEIIYLEDKASMSRSRLVNYIQACIHFIEADLEEECPDSEEWKNYKETGHKFKSVKYAKRKNQPETN